MAGGGGGRSGESEEREDRWRGEGELTCCSLSCLATSLAELPDTSIQVLEKKAQDLEVSI